MRCSLHAFGLTLRSKNNLFSFRFAFSLSGVGFDPSLDLAELVLYNKLIAAVYFKSMNSLSQNNPSARFKLIHAIMMTYHIQLCNIFF